MFSRTRRIFFFFSSRRRHTRWNCDWSSDVYSSDLSMGIPNTTSMRSERERWNERYRSGHGLRQANPRLEQYLHCLRPGRVLDLAGGVGANARSEERRVGKECRSRRSTDREKKKKEK